ncbi:MAG: SurA N-terminal domain-containing protein [Pseudomonadota bacterium]|nr:SurA N-terminal domain-containing protein [Pseudomonadota bacterium]MDP1904858.1 SurA N-terminal domain-containing protein [Pseudomonadota bacterium]MDP2354341.1 SurA N-terminal domain-containing protein [Pseudomonadota bacterium]
MLEAIRERAQGWIARVILVLIALTFAVWGVEGYFGNDGKEPPAAKVNDDEISQRDFLKALKEQSEEMQQQLGATVEDKALRARVLEQLVNTRLLLRTAQNAGFTVLDPQIQAILGGIEQFQEEGKFSNARLEAWLRNQGMGQAELMGMIAQDMLLKQVQIGYGEGAVVPMPTAVRLNGLLAQEREVNEVGFDRKDFLAAVQVDQAAIQADYDAHKSDYATPATLRVQYLVLSQAALAEKVQVSDEQANKFYEANAARFQEPERRRASHILIKIDAAGDAKARAAAKASAEQILAEVKKTPASFDDLARKHSQDPVSGARGGDLGAFTRDMMVKPFSDAAFLLQQGAISGLVETQFGYHIIRLDAIVPGAKIGFALAKADILSELKQQEAQRRFIETAERFSNMVYEQPDSLAPAAKEFGLNIEESGWFDRNTAPAPLASERLLDALLSEDARGKKQNTEAVEVSPNTLVSARVLEYRAAGQRPLAEVAEVIRQKLSLELARKRAIEAGGKALENARAGQPIGWPAPMTVSRMRPLNLTPQSVKAVFRADAGKLPAYAGAETTEGYRLYRINRVAAGQTQPEMVKRIRDDVRRMVAQEEMRAYLENLRANAKIKIAPSALEPKAE